MGSGREHALQRRVALTFDAEHPDRPASPGNQERLLDVLDRLAVPASFFLQGRWVEAHPGTAQRIAGAGHLVGNHGHYHARMQHLSDAGLRHDIGAAEAVIRDATGIDPRPWFRCPFGGGATDERVLEALASAGYRHVGWTVATADWDADRAADDLAAIIAGAGLRGPDEIVLLHTWPDRTLAALPEAVTRLRDAGAALVRIDDLAEVTGAPGPAA